MAVEVAQDLPARLRAAQAAVLDADASRTVKLRHRKAIVLEAIDREHMTHAQVARILGLAKGRISAILASPDPDEDDVR